MLLLLPVIIVGMALETLSVGMVLPALGILMSETYFEQFPALSPVLNYFGRPDHGDLVFWGLVGLASVFLVKNIFLFFQVQLQGTFVYSAQREISLELFRRYLAKDYRFHLETNSSVLIRNLVSEVTNFCSFFLMPMINLITEVLVILALLTLIFLIEPIGTLFLTVILGALVFLFVKATNRVVGRWGKKRLQAEEEKLRHLQQGLGGIKEILLSGKLEFFLQRFHVPNKLSGLMIKREYIFQYVPKLGVEVIAIFGLVCMCLFMIMQGKPYQEVTHMLGLMATAGFRVIPSFSRILNNLQSIRYGWASVDTLAKEFGNYPNDYRGHLSKADNIPEDSELSFLKKVELANVSFSYPESDRDIVSRITLNIPRGSVVGMDGESGSGKSTIINLLLGLIEPTEGVLKVDGQKLRGAKINQWQKMIGYVPQEIYLLDDTIRRNIAFGVDDSDVNDDRVLEVLKIARLDGLIEKTKDGLELLLGERGARLSGGQRQRIGIARAIYHDPEIIILDEATSALDQKTENEILATFEPMIGKKTFLIVAHRKTSLEMCSKVYHLRDGKLLS
jgi:ABC-type multidrug transport system fused ATPase/permease subunit